MNSDVKACSRRILYVQYTNPASYPPLEHSSRILAAQGWKVVFLGTGALGANRLRFQPHSNIIVRQMPFCEAGWRQKVHYASYALWVLAWILYWRPHWVYASDSLSCPVAWVVSFLPGVQILYHEHDSPPREQGSSGTKTAARSHTTVFQRLIYYARIRLARRASLCVLPNEERIERFIADTDVQIRPACVWNCPSLSDVSDIASARVSNSLMLWYHGSIVPSQLPERIINALTLVSPVVRLRFAGYETVGHKGYVDYLKQRAEALGVGSRVEFVGTLPERKQLLEACSQCRVGLALFARTVHQPMTGASNKPFDYLACGLALLVPDLPDWRRMFVESGFGVVSNPEDTKSIAAAVQWFADHPEQTKGMGEAGRTWILEQWNYEKQFEPVLTMLQGHSEIAKKRSHVFTCLAW